MPLTLIAKDDRRSPQRVLTPPCPRCGHDEAMVGAHRTPSAVLFRCMVCGGDVVVHKTPDFSVQF
jgi:rRNA maturation protein Nop10